jgi:hypothetical protein
LPRRRSPRRLPESARPPSGRARKSPDSHGARGVSALPLNASQDY